MKFAEKFSDDEIQNLKLSLIRVFHFIADVDGKIDKKEVKALEIILQNIHNLNYESLNGIFSNSTQLKELEELRQQSGLSDREGLRYISALLDRKASHESAYEFKKSLLAFGFIIAASSGGIFEQKVNDEENNALNLLAKDFEISLRDLMNTNQVQQIIEKINI